MCIANISTIFILGMFPTGFLTLIPKGTYVRLFIMIDFIEEDTLR